MDLLSLIWEGQFSGLSIPNNSHRAMILENGLKNCWISWRICFKSKHRKPLKTVYKSKRVTSKNEITKNKQRRINDILDKISKSGYESLNQEEKDFFI